MNKQVNIIARGRALPNLRAFRMRRVGQALALVLASAWLAALPARSQDAMWLLNPGTGDFNTDANWTPAIAPTGTAFFGATNTPGLSFSAITAIDGFTFNPGATAYTFTNPTILSFTGAGIVINGGSATIINNFVLYFFNASTAGSATIINNFFQFFFDTSTAGNATIINNASLEFFNSSSAANAFITNNCCLVFADTSTAANATIDNKGTVTFQDFSTAANAIIVTRAGANTFFLHNSTAGQARLIAEVGGVIDFSGTTGPAGDGKITAGSIEGPGNFILGSTELTVGGNGLTTEVSGEISGLGGSLVKTGTGTLILSGINTYTGPTTIDSGTLLVNSSIVLSSGVAVNLGGILAGIGIVPSVIVNSGGTISPGASIGTLTVQGNLQFNPGSNYFAEIAATSADKIVVTGTATLAGNVLASFFLGGIYQKSYTILSAAGGLTGTFDHLTTANLPTFFTTYLDYTANDVLLNLVLGLGQIAGLNRNQRSVGSAIDGVFNTGQLPASFASLLNISAASIPEALSQLSGEVGSGVFDAGFRSMNSFLLLLLNPFNTTRGIDFGPAVAFAPEQPGYSVPDSAFAYAAKPPSIPAPENRYGFWAAAHGGLATTNGDASLVGSHTTTTRIAGFATGIDYLLSPHTLVGFALAGGGTSWALSGGLGAGRSDLFEAGIYASTRAGPAYLSAALAYAWHDAKTNRVVTIAGIDMLAADFMVNGAGARLEGGYRVTIADFGVTPYAALQVKSFRAPSYREYATSGSPTFALAYVAQTETVTRGELGAWLSRIVALANERLLILRARFAWAHDFDNGRRINAAFQALPGSSFVIDGAVPASDAALVSLGAELKYRNSVSLGFNFDGEFSENLRSYAATGVFKYVW